MVCIKDSADYLLSDDSGTCSNTSAAVNYMLHHYRSPTIDAQEDVGCVLDDHLSDITNCDVTAAAYAAFGPQYSTV